MKTDELNERKMVSVFGFRRRETLLVYTPLVRDLGLR
jgi:hypothetical protein